MTALFVAVSAVLGLVSNLSGARNAVCSLPALNAQCVRLKLIEPPIDPNAARTALLHRAEGVWGNVGREGEPACTTTMRYAIRHRDGEDYIDLSTTGYESEGRIVSADNSSIFTRTVTPPAQAGTQWELKLEADRLIQVDSSGTPTPLVRCGQ